MRDVLSKSLKLVNLILFLIPNTNVAEQKQLNNIHI